MALCDASQVVSEAEPAECLCSGGAASERNRVAKRVKRNRGYERFFPSSVRTELASSKCARSPRQIGWHIFRANCLGRELARLCVNWFGRELARRSCQLPQPRVGTSFVPAASAPLAPLSCQPRQPG